MRLIDGDALKEIIYEHSYQLVGNYSVDQGMFITGIDQCIDEMPTINKTSTSHATWRCTNASNKFNYTYTCSKCEKIAMGKSTYCPNCGAKMENPV